ncbi:hypothetical protein BKA83DRAFT_4132996 [Pisolithus microcarpus]|nr:hypothetical protein BKA83DRAFT_4132996 [Pisolithus microcarpus]
MAARQIQGSLEKPIRPKLQPQSTNQRKSDLETEIKLGTVKGRYQSKGMREDYLETKKCNRSSMQPSATKDTNHEQAEVASKPREDKIMLKLRGAIEKASKPLGNTASSGHVQAIHDAKSGIEGWAKNWNEVVMSAMASMQCRLHCPICQGGGGGFLVLTLQLQMKTETMRNASNVENVGRANVFDTHHVNTSVSAIDAVESCRADKGIGPGHHIICHQVQKSRSSIALNLPLLFLKGRKWAKTYLPTLLLWLGDQPNVWSVPEGDLVHTLMENAKAIALLECYLASDPDTNVKQTCDALLHKDRLKECGGNGLKVSHWTEGVSSTQGAGDAWQSQGAVKTSENMP